MALLTPNRRTAAAGISVLVAFIVAGSWATAKRIEADLSRRSDQALDVAGIDVAVEYSGRDATLRGTVARSASADDASSIVAGIDGTRRVTSLVDVVPSASPPPPPTSVAASSLTVTGADGAVNVEAVVRREDAASLERALAGLDPDTLDIATAGAIAPASWLELVGPLLTNIRDAASWRIELSSDGTVSATATVDPARVATVTSALESTLEPSPFEADITVIAGPPADQTIRFASGRALLSPAAIDVLDAFAVHLKENPGVQLTIEGHTDNTGSEARNQTLSWLRVDAVVAYLDSQGVDTDRLRTAAFAATRPVASNETASGRAANRRVDLIIEEGD